MLNTLKQGLADEVTVATDYPGPLTDAVNNLPGGSSDCVGTAPTSHTGVTHGPAPLKLAKRFYLMRRQYRRLFRSSDWDFIYANTLRSVLVAATVSKKQAPLVFHLRDRLTADHIPGKALPLIKRLLNRRVNKWIANSRGTAETISAPSTQVAVVYSPVDESFFKLEPPSNGNEVHIAMVGRLAPWKGQLQFIKALTALNALLPTGWKASVVGGALFGEQDYEQSLRSAIDDSSLSDKVTMTGHVDDVASFMNDVDIVVHCSTKPEPFGQVVAQGMAAARAVVASKFGGPAEIISDRENGILVDPLDEVEVAQTLHELIGNPDLRAKLGNEARIAAKPFHAAEVTAQLKSFLFNASPGN